MDKLALKKLFEALIKDYETSETHAILMYSSIHTRDFTILAKKTKEYKKQLKQLLDGSEDAKEI